MRGLFFSIFILVPLLSSSPSWGMEEGSPKKRWKKQHSLKEEKEEKTKRANPHLVDLLFEKDEKTPPSSPAKQPRLAAAHLLSPPSPQPGPSSSFKRWGFPSPQPSPQGGDADRASVAGSLSSEEAALPFEEGKPINIKPSSSPPCDKEWPDFFDPTSMPTKKTCRSTQKKGREPLSLQDFLLTCVLTKDNMKDFIDKVAVPAFKAAPHIMKEFKEDLQDLKESVSNGNTESAIIFTNNFFNYYPLVCLFIKDYLKSKLAVTKKEFFSCKWDTEVGNFLTGLYTQMVTRDFNQEELERFLLQVL